MKAELTTNGFVVFEFNAGTAAWADAAHIAACALSADPAVRAANLRHGGTWFVGVDVLPNAVDGSIDGVPLIGPWRDHICAPRAWHPAQLSIVYPGYPQQDADESDANHRYRIKRHAAHVDGLLPIGPQRRRYLQEPHAFILGLPLNRSDVAPLMVWPGSHHIMGDAFRNLTKGADPLRVDLSEGYQAARRRVFDTITPEPVIAPIGGSILLHRHLLHGVAPWETAASAPTQGRMIAYFRPQFSTEKWLSQDF